MPGSEENLHGEIKKEETSYAATSASEISHLDVRNVSRNIPNSSQQRRGPGPAVTNQVYHNRRPNRPIYGSSSTNTEISSEMGAPLPSRFVVLERVLRNIQKDHMRRHMNWKNQRIGIRSLKLMSNSESQYKRYLLEVSLEHFDQVSQEGFWPGGVRVRVFKGNGKTWNDREEASNDTTESSEASGDDSSTSS